jgi:hypothetical protein
MLTNKIFFKIFTKKKKKKKHSHAGALSMTLYFLVASSIYGRFLTIANESSTTTLIVSVILAAEEILLRVTVGGRDKLVYRVFHPSDSVARIFATPRAHRLRTDIVALDVMLEYASIMTAAVAMSALGITIGGSGAFNAQRVLVDVAFQLAIEFATDFCVVFMEESALGVPVIDGWRTRFRGNKRKYWGTLLYFWTIASAFIIVTLFHPLAGIRAALKEANIS